jgi:hypothetical protein
VFVLCTFAAGAQELRDELLNKKVPASVQAGGGLWACCSCMQCCYTSHHQETDLRLRDCVTLCFACMCLCCCLFYPVLLHQQVFDATSTSEVHWLAAATLLGKERFRQNLQAAAA